MAVDFHRLYARAYACHILITQFRFSRLESRARAIPIEEEGYRLFNEEASDLLLRGPPYSHRDYLKCVRFATYKSMGVTISRPVLFLDTKGFEWYDEGEHWVLE